MIPGKPPKGYFGWTRIDGNNGHIMLKNALTNLSASQNGDNHQYGKGLIVGVVSTLMATGMEFDDACQLAWQHMPEDTHPDRIPETWKHMFNGKIKKEQSCESSSNIVEKHPTGT